MLSTDYILALGNPVYDVISTPFLRRTERVLSGCSTNACIAISKLEYDSLLVGSVGGDYKTILGSDLQERNIESIIYDSQQTGGFGLVYDDSGNRELSVLGVADALPDILPDIPRPTAIILGPILGEISVSLVEYVCNIFNSVPVLLDPQGLLRIIEHDYIAHVHTKAFDEIVKRSTIVKANELETKIVTGIDPRIEPYDAVRALYGFGPKHVAIVTLADAGSIIYDGADFYEIPPYSTVAIDPTGAGDTYAAGFIYKYLENPHDLYAVGCFASCVASIMVENSGPDFPLTQQEAIHRFNDLTRSKNKLKNIKL